MFYREFLFYGMNLNCLVSRPPHTLACCPLPLLPRNPLSLLLTPPPTSQARLPETPAQVRSSPLLPMAVNNSIKILLFHHYISKIEWKCQISIKSGTTLRPIPKVFGCINIIHTTNMLCYMTYVISYIKSPPKVLE